MRLAYLTATYPKASHTFIRRELRALETRGHEIVRLSIRSAGDGLVDPEDREEQARTFHCLEQPLARVLFTALGICLGRPRGTLAALLRVWALWRAGGGLLRPLAYLIEAASLLHHLRGREVEHLHVHFGTNPAAVALLMRALGGPPYSLTVHGPHEFDAPQALALGLKLRDSVFTAAISDYAAAQLRRWSDPADWDKLQIVRCAVSDAFLASAPAIPIGARDVVCVGRLTAAKGQLLLLDAFAALVDEGLDLRLVLAGDGELRPAIEQRIDALGLREHVCVTGWVDEARVRKLLLDARGLVLPSFAEGLPVVIMEALALERPVVSTCIAAIPELVRTGETGWLVPPGNTDALRQALRELVESPVEQLQELGRRGRALVRAHHSLEREVTRLERLIQAAPRSR